MSHDSGLKVLTIAVRAEARLVSIVKSHVCRQLVCLGCFKVAKPAGVNGGT